MIKKISNTISTHSQIALTLSILLLIFFIPYYWDSRFADYFNFLFFTMILLTAILTLTKSGMRAAKFGRIGYVLIIVVLITGITKDPNVELVERIFFVLFLLYVAIYLLLGIVKSREVDSKVIFSAVAVYLLFGFCGAILTAVIMYFQPLAFSLESSDLSLFHQCLYFSFITITTTGYGDILPLKPIAKTMAIFLALFGQLYLTVIIGILIGKYLSAREKN